MPLIFAIDSDKRQSAQLASLLRAHVDADLVQSASATEGLNILQGRVPDLILTASLLSPRDETALGNHLRDLGVAAAHVQTLTIPVLAGAQAAGGKKSKGGGVLAALRREKKTTKPSGCDPEVFAQEVQMYLDRALEQRKALHALLPPDMPVTVAPDAAEALVAAGSAQVESGVEPPTVVVLAPTVLAVVVKAQPAAEPQPSAEPQPAPADVETPRPSVPVAVVVDESVVVDAPVALPSERGEVPLRVEAAVLGAEPVELQALEAQPHVVPAHDAPAQSGTLFLPEPVGDPAAIVSASLVAAEPAPNGWSDRSPEVAPPTTTTGEPVFDRSWAFAAIPAPSAPGELLAPAFEDAALDAIAAEPHDLAAIEVQAMEVPAADPAPAADAASPMESPGGSPLVSLEAEDFAALLAPPPSRIADAIRMPDPPVPTVDMVVSRDLEALAEDFAAAGLTADLPSAGALVEAAGEGEPASGEDSITVIEAASERLPVLEEATPDVAPATSEVAAAPPEVATAAPAGEGVAPDVAIEETPLLEPSVALEAETPAPTVATTADAPADGQPMVPEAALADVPVEAPALTWSWLEGEGAPLADLLAAEAFTFMPAAVQEPPAALPVAVEPVAHGAVEPILEPEIEEPAPVIVADPIAAEVFDPDASTSWNFVTAAPALDDRDAPADAPAAATAVETEQADPAAAPVEIAPDPGTWDPLSAAAWQAAVACAPDTPATAAPAPVVAAAPPEPELEPEVGPEAMAEPVPDPDAPTLDPEVLAILGLAAHRAGLDALESLDAEPEPDPAPRASASNGSGRRKPRMDRGRLKTSTRRDKRADRPAPHRSPRPAQDEWGMYDPAQCGPDALLDSDEWRVDEDEDDEDDRRRPPRPRAFGY